MQVDEKMNIVYASDNNYVKLLAVSLCSLFINNPNREIDIFIIDCGIDEKNKNKLNECVQKYNKIINWIDIFTELNNNKYVYTSTYPKAIYGRLYIEQLPKYIKKVLYLDCDTIITSDIYELWAKDTENSILYGRKESLSFCEARSLALGEDLYSTYINSGILIIDMERWRQLNCKNRIIDTLDNYKEKLYFFDQDAINIALKDYICPQMPYEYNTPCLRNEHDIKILHYGGSAARANKRDFKKITRYYLNKTPWKDDKTLVTCSRSRRIKDNIMITLRDDYLPNGNKVYHFILNTRKKLRR